MSQWMVLTNLEYLVWVRSSAMRRITPEDAKEWEVLRHPVMIHGEHIPKAELSRLFNRLISDKPPGLYKVMIGAVRVDVLTEETQFTRGTVLPAPRADYELFFGVPPEVPKPVERTPLDWTKVKRG